MIRLVIPGEPKGKGRPRFVRATGRTYTPSATVDAEDRIRLAWQRDGSRRIDGPLRVDVEVVLARPQSHRRKDGTLSAAGARSPWPTRKPDVDNVLKLLDALNGLAFRDDADVVLAGVLKRWAAPGESEHTEIKIRPLPLPVEKCQFCDRERAA